MTAPDIAVTLPPMEIVHRSITRSLLRLYAALVAMAAVIAAVCAITGRWLILAGFTVALVVLPVIALIEIPLLRKARTKRQRALARSMPAGEFYAAPASLLPSDGTLRMPASGTIFLSVSGVRFSREVLGPPIFETTWERVSRLQLKPPRGLIGVGILTLSATDGTTTRFNVPEYSPMCRALQAHIVSHG
ncbi:MAG TPA: hypothetical protein VFN61_12610 [Acidimicrobiales bacterium]|nr:hypothetical protein [Acidimicrobiales bacterium]